VKLTVAAGVKLMDVFPQIGALFTKAHPEVTFNFEFRVATELVAAIERGEPADIFASISSMEADQLVNAKRMDAYTVFSTNELFLITPKANPAGIATLEDLRTKPVKLVIGAETSVTGAFTRMALSYLDTVLGPGYSTTVLDKVVSIEGGGTTTTEAIERGQADAGFAFSIDLIAADVNRISLPAAPQTVARCPIGVLRASKNAMAAQQFVDFLLTAPAQALLKQEGFGPPPAASS
jgi:molybdate transport system substrate-binding protein